MKGLDWLTNPRSPVTLWRTILGWLCVGAGVLGLVLPIIPGIPLLIVGLVVLSARYRWASDCLHWVKRQAKRVSATRLQEK
ncbi:MAG: PGPGW domain-containing protein [Acidobacteriaceae bacterium]